MTDTIFSLLIDLAEKERTANGKRLAEANARLNAARAQLSMLEQYRSDYAIKQQKNAAGGTTGDSYRNYTMFMSKLDSAIVHQQKELAVWQARVEELNAANQQAHRKVRSFETLRDQRAHAARIMEMRAMQKNDDEMAARVSSRSHVKH
jgi:flagellar FliJ protein